MRAKTQATQCPQRQNPGGRTGVPAVIKTKLRELSPRVHERVGELLDSGDERVPLEAAKAILDRLLGRPAIQTDGEERRFGRSPQSLIDSLAVARGSRSCLRMWRSK